MIKSRNFLVSLGQIIIVKRMEKEGEKKWRKKKTVTEKKENV